MKKCFFNGLEEGGIYQLRTNEFEVIDGFEKVLSDFDEMYESYQNSETLFNYSGNQKIVLIAETFTLSFDNTEIDIYNPEEVKMYFNNLGCSNLTIDILIHMIEMEDFSVANIIEKISKSGQKIKIQTTDTLYGNNEFEIIT
jgi:hypothetical protein